MHYRVFVMAKYVTFLNPKRLRGTQEVRSQSAGHDVNLWLFVQEARRIHYNACFVNSHRAASRIQTPRLQALRYGQEDADLVRALQVSRPDTRDCVVSSLFLFIPDLPAHRSPTASVTFS